MHCAISCYVIIVVVVYVFIMSGEINMYALAQVLYSLQNNKKNYTQVGAKTVHHFSQQTTSKLFKTCSLQLLLADSDCVHPR